MDLESENKKEGVGLALSGGGSRAIAFHYGVLEALNDLQVTHKINVVSAISGGAVIAALWVLYWRNWKLFSARVEDILRSGLQASLIEKLMHPSRFFAHFLNFGLDIDLLADVLDDRIFNGLELSKLPSSPLLILNAVDLKTGSNFKFSRTVSGSYKDGGHVLPNFRLSQAVACSAAHPLFFAPKNLRLNDNTSVVLADGGAYDCVGANALMPDKDIKKSILVQNCETIITSDASSPFVEGRKEISRSIFHGLYSSYLALSSRNRSLIYNKLYLLNQTKEIPFLGTIKMDSKDIDLNVGWSKNELEFINGYRTDFKPVTGKALQHIKERGKKSAKYIITTYLEHLIND